MRQGQIRIFTLWAILLLALLPFAALAQIQYTDSAPNIDSQREWTVMVYLDADNDLEPFALSDLNELEAGYKGQSVEVIALIDRAEGYETGYGDWKDSRIYRIRADSNPKQLASEVVASPGEINMGDPAVLSAFVSQTIRKYPAKRYALVMWDHGGGWRELAIDHKAPGVASGHDGLSIMDVGSALRSALQSSPVEKLDLIGFDMCLMAQVETAWEVKDLADVMVASQAIEPGDGWPYAEVISAFQDTSKSVPQVGSEIVKVYGQFYDARNEVIATQSAIDLTKLDLLGEAFNAVTQTLEGKLGKNWPELTRSIFWAENYNSTIATRGDDSSLSSIDMADFIERIEFAKPEWVSSAQKKQFQQALDEVVLDNYTSERHKLSKGLAIYAPFENNQFNTQYLQTRFAQENAWPSLLRNMHRVQTEQRSEPQVTKLEVVDYGTSDVLESAHRFDFASLKADVSGQNILWIEMIRLLYDAKNDGYLVLGKNHMTDWKDSQGKPQKKSLSGYPEFKGDRHVVSGEVQLLSAYVTDGENAFRASIDSTDVNDPEHYRVPVLFERAGYEPFFATILFAVTTWEPTAVIGELPQPDGSVALRGITPQADDKITLLFEFIPKGEGENRHLRGGELRWGKGLTMAIDQEAFDNRSVLLGARAVAIGGESSFKFTELKLKPVDPQWKAYYDNAKKLTADQLVGTWQWYNSYDTSKTIPVKTHIRRSNSNPDVLVGEIEGLIEGGPRLLIWDNRMAPVMRFFTIDDQNNITHMDPFMVSGANMDAAPPTLMVRFLAPGSFSNIWRKVGAENVAGQGAPTQAATPKPKPKPKPKPRPKTVDLTGAWLVPDGYSQGLEFEGNQYAYYENGDVADYGYYEVRGNQIVVQSAVDGGTNTYHFRSDGRVLKVSGHGLNMTLYREVE